MGEKQRCENCRWLRVYERFNLCKRYPPNLIDPYNKEAVQPPVEFDDWCGEWSWDRWGRNGRKKQEEKTDD